MNKWFSEGLMFHELDLDGLARAVNAAGDAFLLDDSASPYLIPDEG